MSEHIGNKTAVGKDAGILRFAGLHVKTLIVVGCLVSLGGFLGVRRGTDEQVHRDFLLSSEARVEAVQRELTTSSDALQLMRAYFESPRNDSSAVFDQFAAKTLSSNRDLRSVAWAPRVRSPDRPAFEARLSRPGGIVSESSPAKPQREGQRQEYFPVEYTYPRNRASPPIGYDLLSNAETAQALKRAITTGEPSSTGRLHLWTQSGDDYGVTTFLAIYDGPDKGRDASWRAEHCLGVTLSLIQSTDLLSAALRAFDDQRVRTYIFDLSGPARTLLFVHPPRRFGRMPIPDPSPDALLQQEKLVYARKLSVGGRDWQVLCVGTDFTTTGSDWQPLVFLLCGLAATCGVALYLHMISRYTFDLANANVYLRSQVEDRQKAQDELAYQAFHDALTGLPNRRQFSQRFNEAVEESKQTHHSLALFFVDLDGFKIINDTLGHAVGDAVLKAVAERFRNCIGRRDVVARTGGDEFNILLVEAGTGALAERVAQGLLDSLSQPIEVGGRFLTLSASIGFSLYPEHGNDFQELALCADAAMYFAKKRGKNRFHRYTRELAVNTRRGLELAMSLRGAIERNELCVFFHPIIGIGNEPTLRFEALIRWRHPENGLLGPSHFFAIAEETGLAAPIGNWVIREACRMARMWQPMAHRPIGVSVNVSGLQFSRPDFMDSVDAALAESGLEPKLLEIEMTESAVVGEIEESLERLGVLRRKGVTVAVDEFGTGYSSLTYLENLPIDALKIDRSFLPRGESNFRRTSLLRSLIALGHGLNLRVVVGGIESPRQFELVRGMGPNEVQGYLFARPLSAPAVPEYIEQWNQRQGSAELDRILEITRVPPDLVLVPSRTQAI